MPTPNSSLAVVRVPLADLCPDPANPRAHGEENLDAITASLRRFGQAEPLVVQKGTRRIVAGHGRLTAMKALGWTEADVVELEVDDLTATALAIALNRSAELAQWDDATLAKLLSELDVNGGLDGVGFSDADLKELLDSVAEAAREDCDEDTAPLPLDTPVSKRGDIWVLGTHRLMCGNSADRQDLIKLLAGATIQLVNSDPPYNVKVEPRSNNAIAAGLSSFAPSTHHQRLDVERDPSKAVPTTAKMRPKDRPLENDFLPPEEFERMLDAWFGNMAFAMEPGAAFYIWGGYANCANYPPALKQNGLYFSQAIIWNKLHPVLTRKDYMGAHEWCFYGWREGAGHNYYGPNNETDLWEVKKVNPQSMIHLTEKPVELAVRAITNSSKRGENVLDLFGGSGSTIMACEHTERRGYSMEIDAAYADVIVRRWQEKTKQQATLEGDGRPWDEVAAERTVS